MIIQTTRADAQTLIGYLIATNGNSALAAVRASKDLGEEITEPQLLATIASDPNSLSALSRQINLLMLLKALDAFRQTHMAFLERLPNLNPKDTARTYLQLMETINMIGRPVVNANDSNANPFDTVMRLLPPDVADSIEFLMKNGEQAASNPEVNAESRGHVATVDPESTDYGDIPLREEDRSTSYGLTPIPPVKGRR